MWVIQAGILLSEPVRVPHPINSHQYYWGASQMPLVVKNPLGQCKRLKDTGSIPGSGRSPGGGHGNPLQYSCLENSMDRGAWRAMVHIVVKS